MNIVVGYDHPSDKGLDVAVQHAKVFGAKLFVVYSTPGGARVEQDVLNAATEALEKLRNRLNADGIECETRLLARGLEPGEDLVQFARDAGAEEIVIGIRRKSKVGKLLFGSNAQYVILNASCPVVSVP